jgi:hypothetical protein
MIGGVPWNAWMIDNERMDESSKAEKIPRSFSSGMVDSMIRKASKLSLFQISKWVPRPYSHA